MSISSELSSQKAILIIKPGTFFNKFRYWRMMIVISPFLCGIGHAETLSSLLDMARINEPAYLSAQAAVQAANARTDQAFGSLLPQINVTASVNFNKRNYQTRSSGVPPAQDQYDSDSQQISLTQPIWKCPNYIGLQQAETAAFQAEQQLANTEQELLAKVVSVWFDLLAARDQELFTQRQIAVAQHRLEEAKRGFDLNYIGQPELEEAKAKQDQAMAEQVSAETDLNLKRAALEQIVGTVDQLTPTFMREDAELADLSSKKLKTVLESVETENHNILAAMHAHEAASHEVRKQQAEDTSLPWIWSPATEKIARQSVVFPDRQGMTLCWEPLAYSSICLFIQAVFSRPR